MDCSLPGSSVHGHFPGKNIGVGCHAVLQEIFPTQASNPGLPHFRQIRYCLSHQGSPRILEWVAYHFSRGIFLTQGLNQGLLHCRWILYQLSYQGSPTSLHDYWKNHSLTIQIFVGTVMSLLFNTLSRFVTAVLPRSRCLLIFWLQSPSTLIMEPKKMKSDTFPTFSPSICHAVIGPDAKILVF